jgi:hypothetical protein
LDLLKEVLLQLSPQHRLKVAILVRQTCLVQELNEIVFDLLLLFLFIVFFTHIFFLLSARLFECT